MAEFLRTRREQLRPGDVGLPDSGRRRTPGLRREEVATLAGISIDYLVRLEQGRDTRPSLSVIAALAEALRLDDDDSIEASETAPHLGHSEVTDSESDRGMVGVDHPKAGGQGQCGFVRGSGHESMILFRDRSEKAGLILVLTGLRINGRRWVMLVV